MLAASHLTRRFGDRVAVEDLSFELRPGEIFALAGPNGAGKTTTLRMLAGLIPPTSGHVLVDGEALSARNAPALRRRIGFLTETPGLWDRLSVRTNLGIYARLYELEKPDRAVDDVLDLFDARTTARRSCRRASSSVSRWRVRCCIAHGPCSSTSRPPVSIRKARRT